MKGIIKVVGLVAAVLFACHRKFFIAYYGTLFGLNVWPKIVVAGIITAIIAGLCQYDGQARRRYNERMFIFLSVIFSVVASVAFFCEGLESIITFFDHTLAMTDSPAWSVILAPWVAMAFGVIYCVMMMYLSAIIGECRRQSIIRKQRA